MPTQTDAMVVVTKLNDGSVLYMPCYFKFDGLAVKRQPLMYDDCDDARFFMTLEEAQRIVNNRNDSPGQYGAGACRWDFRTGDWDILDDGPSTPSSDREDFHADG